MVTWRPRSKPAAPQQQPLVKDVVRATPRPEPTPVAPAPVPTAAPAAATEAKPAQAEMAAETRALLDMARLQILQRAVAEQYLKDRPNSDQELRAVVRTIVVNHAMQAQHVDTGLDALGKINFAVLLSMLPVPSVV